MPDDDTDVRSKPDRVDPNGLLTPSEKVTALFTALKDHVNNDLTRKHGDECDVCKGSAAIFPPLPAEPAMPAQRPRRTMEASQAASRRGARTRNAMRSATPTDTLPEGVVMRNQMRCGHLRLEPADPSSIQHDVETLTVVSPRVIFRNSNPFNDETQTVNRGARLCLNCAAALERTGVRLVRGIIGCGCGNHTSEVVTQGTNTELSEVGMRFCVDCTEYAQNTSAWNGYAFQNIDFVDPTGTRRQGGPLGLQEQQPDDDSRMLTTDTPSTVRCGCSRPQMWYISSRPAPDVGESLGHTYCSACCRTIRDNQVRNLHRSPWHGVRLHPVTENNLCTGFILNGRLIHQQSCAMHLS